MHKYLGNIGDKINIVELEEKLPSEMSRNNLLCILMSSVVNEISLFLKI